MPRNVTYICIYSLLVDILSKCFTSCSYKNITCIYKERERKERRIRRKGLGIKREREEEEEEKA